MFLSEWCEFPSAPCLAGKKNWLQLASRCGWNRACPWHASKLVSFLLGLRTYQHPCSHVDESDKVRFVGTKWQILRLRLQIVFRQKTVSLYHSTSHESHTEGSVTKKRYFTYNVTMRLIRATIVAVEKQYILGYIIKFFLPTDAQVNFLKKFKIYIKTAPTRFGAVTPSSAQPRKFPLDPTLTVLYSDLPKLSSLHGLLLAQNPPMQVPQTIIHLS